MPITYDIQKDGLYKRGVAFGMEKGMENEKEKAVLRGLEYGMTYEQISIMTELSIEQIKKIEQKYRK